MVGWGGEALKSINNASMTGCAVPEPWPYPHPNPDQSAHYDPNLAQQGPLYRDKKRDRLEKTPVCRGRGNPLADLPHLEQATWVWRTALGLRQKRRWTVWCVSLDTVQEMGEIKTTMD